MRDDTDTVTDQASPVEPVQPTDATKRKSKMATTAKKAKSAPKARKAVKAKSTARRVIKKGAAKKGVATGINAKGHREGSIKSKAHDIFDKVGDNDKARAQVLKLGVKETTVSSWFSTFRNV